MKQKILQILDQIWAEYVNYEHIPVFSCDEAKWVDVPWKRVKSLLLRNKNASKFYMVVLEDEKKLNSELLRKILHENKLSFASEERMIEKIWVKPWHVSPFACINNLNNDILILFDENLKESLIGFHPWQNDNTVVLNISFVEKFLENVWNEYKYIELN